MRWMLVFLAIGLASCASEPKSERVATNGAWAVNQDSEICFAYTLTYADDNSSRQEVDARLYITSYRDNRRREEPSIHLKDPVPEGSPMYIDIGDRRVAFFTDGNRRSLWLERDYDEKALIDLMLNSEHVTVVVWPKGRDRKYLSFYTLGLAAALETLREICPSPYP